MQKTFTVSIPNEMFVSNFSQEKTASFNYEGPEIVKVLNTSTGKISGTITDDMIVDESQVVEIDANLYPAAALHATGQSTEHEYTYTDEVNHDNSIYKKISNPRINDWYDLYYHPNRQVESDDGLNVGPWELRLITKEYITKGEIATRKNLAFVKEKLQYIELTTDVNTQYTAFVTACESYLETMANVFPWKYVEITNPAVPKIPLSVIKAINEIPTELGQ
jgi:hypothetical protein